MYSARTYTNVCELFAKYTFRSIKIVFSLSPVQGEESDKKGRQKRETRPLPGQNANDRHGLFLVAANLSGASVTSFAPVYIYV